MRIVHTTLRYPPASGGAEEYAYQLVERTRNTEQDRDVRVLTTKLRTHGPISELGPEQLLNDPPYVQRIHHASTPGISYPRLQALQYYIRHHKPTILHGYGFWYHPADAAARYARKNNIPFILHPIYYENDIRNKWTWQLYKKTIGKNTFASADVVAVISPYEQSLIEQAGFLVKKFVMLPPGIDMVEFERPRQNPFLKRKIKGTVLLTASRISQEKGIDDVIKALPEIVRQQPDIQLAVVGEDFGAQQSLQQQADRLGVTKHVHFLGKIEREQLIGAFQHASIFIHPTRFEAFGIVLAEAQAAGVPVVARNVAATPYVVAKKNHVNLFKTPDDLVSKILQTLTLNPADRNTQVQSGQQYVQQTFSWDTTVQRLIALYSELVP